MLNEYERNIVGDNKRVTIPMGDAFTLRHVADHLRGLATALDHWSRMTGTPEFSEQHVMMLVAGEIDKTNRAIRKSAEQAGIEVAVGRPKGRKTGEQLQDEGGTVIVTGFHGSQHLGKMGR